MTESYLHLGGLRLQMRIPMILVTVILTGTGDAGAMQQVEDGAMRVEFEHTLHVPEHVVEPLWSYLLEQYDGENPAVREFGPEFSTAVSHERFVDRYFDTHDMALRDMGGGIRHRIRFLPDDSDHRKHERELVQVKAPVAGAPNLMRSEVKFTGRRYRRARHMYDGHPLIGVIRRSEREGFVGYVSTLGIDAEHLYPKLVLEQERRRVYIYRGTDEFATITLDRVSSRLWWRNVSFHVVEIEANEKTFTEADEEVRDFMIEATTGLEQRLLAAFPELEPDPTPKYQVTLARFESRYALLPWGLRYGAPIVETLLGFLALLLVPGYLVMRRRPR